MLQWLFGIRGVSIHSLILNKLELISQQNKELLSMRDRQRIVNMTVQLQRSTNRLAQAIGEQAHDPIRRPGSPGAA